MPRIERQYECTCDGCRQKIDDVNDENDVSLNSAKYVYCPSCYHNICALQEIGFNPPVLQDDPVAWYDPSNPDPGQSVTFERIHRSKWPHLYPTPLYRRR